MASDVVFRDDTHYHGQQLHVSSEMDVSADVLLNANMGSKAGGPGSPDRDNLFLISRLNDSTSYFFTWFCKHFRVKLSPAPTHCPICLEAVTNSIELQCGHAFCRQCLVASAARNFNTCALCRREQVLHPELLRAQFDDRRMRNLAKRLHRLACGSVHHLVPAPIKLRSLSPPPPPVTVSDKLAELGVSQRRSRAESWDAASPSSHASDRVSGHGIPFPRVTSIVEEKPTLEHEPNTKSEDPWAGDVGDTPLQSLQGRWQQLCSMGRLLSGPGGDVGAMSADALRRRRSLAQAGARADGFSSDVGAADIADLRAQYLGLQSAVSAPTSSAGAAGWADDVGALNRVDLQARWAATFVLGAIGGGDVGGMTLEELARVHRREEQPALGEGDKGQPLASVHPIKQWTAAEGHEGVRQEPSGSKLGPVKVSKGDRSGIHRTDNRGASGKLDQLDDDDAVVKLVPTTVL